MRERERPPAGPPADERADNDAATATDTEAPLLVAAYRHDVHKLRGRSHAAAADVVAGVRVNEPVPQGADRDAARLSRPEGEPTQTVPAHASPYRLSLLTGETDVTTPRDSDGDVGMERGLAGAALPLVTPTDPARLHAAWLTSRVAATYNESIYDPYTSLKYHTLLVAALLAAYRDGNEFADLYLAVTPGRSNADSDAVRDGWTAGDSERRGDAVRSADGVAPHETVLWTPPLALHVTPEPGDRPAVRLGKSPRRSFGRVWARLPAHPLPVDVERRWRLLDAQLRRVRAFSTALQYIEEFVAGRGAAPGDGGDAA